MSEDLERRLRAALRPVDPGDRFTQNVLARAKSQRQRAAFVSMWVAVAASMLVCVGLAMHHRHERHERHERGLEARRQLLEALQTTSDKLDLAYRAVKRDDGT